VVHRTQNKRRNRVRTMSEKPVVVLGDEQDSYNKDTGEFNTYLPVEVRVDNKEQAKTVGKIISEQWENYVGGDE